MWYAPLVSARTPLDLIFVESGREKRLSDLWSGSLDTSDTAFRALLGDLSAAHGRGAGQLRFPPFTEPEISEPGAWNLRGDVRFASEFPDAWDTLSPDSPNFALKAFERRLYLAHLGAELEALPRGASVLDVGGGIGRFACEWLDRGHSVTLVDANAQALGLALGHLARIGGQFRLLHLAAENLFPLADESFFAVSAMEVFCYLSDPERGFREAARVLRPGGVLFASVESPVGALPLGERHSREAIAAIQGRTEQAIENDTWVQYFTPERLRDVCRTVGLVAERIVGTHFLTDGPMHHLVEVERLGDPAYEAALIELERHLAVSPRWGNAGRAWLLVARKPG